MLRRSVNFADESDRRLGPLGSFFALLPLVPNYSLRESLVDVFEGCRLGTIDIDADELNNIVDFCEQFANGIAQSGEPGELSEPFIGSIALYTIEFPSGEKRGLYYVLNSRLRSEDRNQIRPFVRFLWLMLHALKTNRGSKWFIAD